MSLIERPGGRAQRSRVWVSDDLKQGSSTASPIDSQTPTVHFKTAAIIMLKETGQKPPAREQGYWRPPALQPLTQRAQYPFIEDRLSRMRLMVESCIYTVAFIVAIAPNILSVPEGPLRVFCRDKLTT